MRCVAFKQMLLASSSSTEGENGGNIRSSAAPVEGPDVLSAPILIHRDRIPTNIATVCLMSDVPTFVRDRASDIRRSPREGRT